jgi:exosome complex component CSL4
MAAQTFLPEIAIPGKILGPISQYLPGPGTHIHVDNVVASQLGHVVITQPKQAIGPIKRLTKIVPIEGLKKAALPTISVSRSAGGRKQEVLPDVGNVVLCRVTRIMPRQAIVSIRQVGGSVLDTEWQGVIRQQDVRATEKDKVKMYESFKPGDLVRAQVVSSFISSFLRTFLC